MIKTKACLCMWQWQKYNSEWIRTIVSNNNRKSRPDSTYNSDTTVTIAQWVFLHLICN